MSKSICLTFLRKKDFYSKLLLFCFVTYKKNLPEKLNMHLIFKNVNRNHIADAQMSMLPFGFQSIRDPYKCTGLGVEGNWLPLQTSYFRRAFTWIKQCSLANLFMALEKHVCMNSCKLFLIFSGMKNCYQKNQTENTVFWGLCI